MNGAGSACITITQICPSDIADDAADACCGFKGQGCQGVGCVGCHVWGSLCTAGGCMAVPCHSLTGQLIKSRPAARLSTHDIPH